MFLIAEVFILIFAMLIAMARVSRSPWLMPLRVIAIVYTDVVRGIPTILLVYLLAFGMPALRLQGLPSGTFFWATVALIISYSAYVAEVFRSGIESVHPSQWSSAAGARPLPRPDAAARDRPAGGAPRRTAAAQRLRLAAEGHRARVVRRRSSRRSSWRATTATTTSTTRRYVVVACFFIADDRAARAAVRLADRADAAARAGGCPVSALLEVSNLRKSYGDKRRARRRLAHRRSRTT